MRPEPCLKRPAKEEREIWIVVCKTRGGVIVGQGAKRRITRPPTPSTETEVMRACSRKRRHGSSIVLLHLVRLHLPP